MKIGLVLHPYKEAQPSGLGRAVAAFAGALKDAAPQAVFIEYTKQSLGGGRLWLERLRSVPRADVYLFFTPVLPLFWKPSRAVVIVHDIGYLDIPMKAWRRTLLAWRHRRACRDAWKIVAVSQATKTTLVRRFMIPAEKITVIYNGANDFSLVAPELVRDLPEKFFLFAGVVKERKNVLLLVRAFGVYVSDGGDASLVIAGKCEGAYAEQVREKARSLGNRVRFAGFVSDGQLAYLYHRALGLVYPSLAEGFGMTIVEAMTCGLPVIASTDAAIVEVVGDAGILVGPADIDALARAMSDIAADSARRMALSSAAKRRAGRFSWSHAGEALAALIQE